MSDTEQAAPDAPVPPVCGVEGQDTRGVSQYVYAAAPELYEALKAYRRAYQANYANMPTDCAWHDAEDLAADAMAKASGSR